MIMDDVQLDDLKQFIEATVSQSEERITTELRTEIKSSAEKLEKKMEDGFAGVGDAIEEIHKVTDSHETRITNLEQQAA